MVDGNAVTATRHISRAISSSAPLAILNRAAGQSLGRSYDQCVGRLRLASSDTFEAPGVRHQSTVGILKLPVPRHPGAMCGMNRDHKRKDVASGSTAWRIA